MKRTYKYDPKTKKMVETTSAKQRAKNGALHLLQGDRLYSDKPFKAHDGTIINSRKKHREYMKRHDLTTADDFPKFWAQEAERRADAYTENRQQAPERREAIARAMHDLQRKSRRG